MESFYGGRQGASFLIKKSFKYINEQDPAYQADLAAKLADGVDEDFAKRDLAPLTMELCFLDGNYQEVWYNEHCIIDTTNKNNPNNGKIFRRVLQTQDTNGNTSLPYEYLGTIVGPSSGAPMLKPQSGLLDFETIRSQFPEGHWDGLGLSEDKDGKTTLKIYDPSFSDGDLSTWPSSVTLKEESITIDNEGMVPGAVIKGEYVNGVFENTAVEYTDDIKYNWFNVRKNTENDDGVVESWCYIGFKIPYPVFSTSAIYKTPGTRPKAYEVNRNDDTDSIEHPFWYDWRFEIPGGLRGVSIENIFINDTDVEDNNNNNLYEVSAYIFDDLWYNTATDTYAFKEDAAPKSYKDRSWFCKARILNPSATTDSPELLKQTDNSDTVTFFLGEITEIDNVTLDTETGHLEFVYHNQASDVYDLRYPIDVRWDVLKGDLDVEYSYANPQVEEEKKIHEWEFTYPKTIAWEQESDKLIDDTGEKDISYFTGQFDVDYTHYDNLTEGQKKECPNSGKFGYMRKVVLSEGENEKSGTITFVNTIDEHSQTYNFSYPKNLTFNQDQDGNYNGSWDIDYYGAENKSGQFDFVDNAVISDTAGTITFHHTKNGDDVQDLIYVKDIAADAETGVFTAVYSDSTTKELEIFDYPKSITFTDSTGEYVIDYSNKDDVTGQFGFVKSVEIDSSNGKMNFTNTKSELSQSLEFVYPKTIQMDSMGNVSYTSSASRNIDMGQLAFIDDVFVDSAHQLWIAYTDNAQMENQGIETGTPLKDGVPLENGKTYINYGQTISKLGVESSPITGPDTEKILEQFESTYPLGVKDGEVTGQLFVVTTSDKNNPVSYFVMWNPNTQKWEIVSEIAGSPVGIPAQIGSDFTSWTYENVSLFADGNMQFIQYPNNEVESTSLTLNTPWR